MVLQEFDKVFILALPFWIVEKQLRRTIDLHSFLKVFDGM
jgi:hypothetical protein